MKTPKKVIEKISLPLMFVTFVMAVLVFAVSPVSAAPDLCTVPVVPYEFCDQDGDGWIRDHKKCPSYCGSLYKDIDDDDCSDPVFPLPECGVVSSDGDIYTAELIIAYEYLDTTGAGASSGAFRFAEGDEFGDFKNLIDPIPVIIGKNPKDLGLGPLLETDVEMWRPDAIWEECDYVEVVEGEGNWIPDSDDLDCKGWQPGEPYPPMTGKGPHAYPGVDQETWDRMFAIGCPELVTELGYIDHILSLAGDWNFGEPGNYRLILRDIQLTAVGGVKWDVTMQLIASDEHPYTRSTGEWLPDGGDTHHLFFLTKGNMWGREVGGGPGGRQSCHKAPSGSDERMEGFFLWNPDTCNGDEACEHEATSVMEIAILP